MSPRKDNPIDERTSAELYKNLKTKEFSDDLYRHLASRKDVEGTQLYTEHSCGSASTSKRPASRPPLRFEQVS